MKSVLRVGLDLDGVFADFNQDFAGVLVRVSGRDLFPKPWREPDTFQWMRSYGYKPSEISSAWDFIERDPLWWDRLPQYSGTATALAELDLLVRKQKIALTFLTTRPGANAHWQSVEWLFTAGIERPQVCICMNPSSKGLIAQALRLEVYVDDWADNLHAVWKYHPSCRLFLYDQPWNQTTEMPHASRLKNLVQLVDKIKEYAGV